MATNKKAKKNVNGADLFMLAITVVMVVKRQCFRRVLVKARYEKMIISLQ